MNYLQAIIPMMIAEFQLLKSKENLTYAEELFLEQTNAQISNQSNMKRPVVLNLIGPITKYSTWKTIGTQFLGDIMKSLDSNSQVSGIVLNIDSGGGMVSGTAELTATIKQLAKPTVAYTNGYMCSAALDIASGCDYRMANPHADMIGSIGTMLSYQDFSAMFEKWGAKIYELYAPQSSEKNKEWRELMKGNEKDYTERLQHLAQNFIDRMKENFGENLKDDGKVFKGKTYTPQEALELGLINGIGTLEEAIELI